MKKKSNYRWRDVYFSTKPPIKLVDLIVFFFFIIVGFVLIQIYGWENGILYFSYFLGACGVLLVFYLMRFWGQDK